MHEMSLAIHEISENVQKTAGQAEHSSHLANQGVEIAYVMGHQATDSIARYGDKRFGRAEAVQVKPAREADLSKVRTTHAAYARSPSKALRISC